MDLTLLKRLSNVIESNLLKLITLGVFLFHSIFKMRAAWSAYEKKLTGYDGGYYLHVAMNVRDSLGLVTYDSPFHHGIPEFPHPSPIYPLWPILLGLTGRLFDIHLLGHFLPAIFSILIIVLAYRFGREVVPAKLRVPQENADTGINAGHFLALLFMVQPGYLATTITPYSEGLSWLIMMVFLLRSVRLLERLTPAGGIEFGIWMGLLFLARAQFLLVALAFFAWISLQLSMAFIKKRSGLRETFIFGLLGTTAFSIVIYPEIHFISEVSLHNPFWTYLRFDQFQVTQWLPRLRPMWPTNGVADWTLDRLNGFLVAFSPTGPHTYFKSYSVAAAALPLPIMVAASRLLRRKKFNSESLEIILESRPFTFFVIFATAGWLSIHTLHKQLWAEWSFNTRQGMTVIFAFMLGWSMLVHSHGWLRTAAKSLLLVTFLLTIERHDHSAIKIPKVAEDISTLGRQVALHSEGAPLIVMPGMGKLLAPWSGNVGFHDLVRGDGPEEIACIHEHLGAKKMLLSPAQARDPSVLRTYGISKDTLVQNEEFTQSTGGWVLLRLPINSTKCPQ